MIKLWFWLLGRVIWYFFTLQPKECEDAYWWLVIHSTHKGKRVK